MFEGRVTLTLSQNFKPFPFQKHFLKKISLLFYPAIPPSLPPSIHPSIPPSLPPSVSQCIHPSNSFQETSTQCSNDIFSSHRLAAAQVELDAVMATLKEKQDSLAAVEEKVDVQFRYIEILTWLRSVLK